MSFDQALRTQLSEKHNQFMLWRTHAISNPLTGRNPRFASQRLAAG